MVWFRRNLIFEIIFLLNYLSQFSKYDPFSSDSFFKDNKTNPVDPTSRIIKPSTTSSLKAQTFLFPLSESEEFHDPFSEMNLFLAKRIKREILREKNPRKWSRKIQSLLLKEILPDFSKRFPGYRLGSAALQKTWNKVLYYLQTIQQKKGALQPNGKLNIDYLIRENLKNLEGTTSDFHPYNMAHSLAVKISECIAAIDGDRPELENLTRTIWAVQKHLIAGEDKIFKAPFDSIDSLDKLIVRFQLEELAKQEKFTKDELSLRIKKHLVNIKGLEKIRNIEELTPGLMALLAEKLYPHLQIHKRLSEEEVSQITAFIKSQLRKSSIAPHLDKEKCYSLLASRIFFLYKLASQISLSDAEESLEAAIQYVYSLSTDSLQINTPVLRQEVYEFVDQEIRHLKEEKVADPLKHLLATLVELFSQAEALPKLPTSLFDELEIVIWKVISEESECLSKLPGYLRRIIFEEMASVHIDHTSAPFKKIVQITLSSLKNLRSIELDRLESKLSIWTNQNDMVASHLHFDTNDPLLKCIESEFEKINPHAFDIEEFISKVTHIYLAKFKSLSGWPETLQVRIKILFKYLWYQKRKEENHSSFDRHILYQYNLLATHQERQFPELLIAEMDLTFKKTVPLFPFNEEHCRALITSTLSYN